MSIDFYRTAFKSLGILSTLNLQVQKHLFHSLLRLTTPDLKFPIFARRNTTDLMVWHQVFIDREYGCTDHLDIKDLILDLGANVGYTSAYFICRFPQARVIAVEPDQGNYDLLMRNLRPYRSRYNAFQAAVWPRRERLSFNLASLHQGEWGRRVEPCESGGVEPVTVPELMNGFDRISLLKADIEGAETVLFSDCQGWLGKVDNIVIELHGEEARRSFFKAIAGRGFKISQSGELTTAFS